MNIKNFFEDKLKQLARWTLRDELVEFQTQLDDVADQAQLWEERYKKLTSQRQTIPNYILQYILQIIPDANQFAKGLVTADDLKNGEFFIFSAASTIPQTKIRASKVSQNSITFFVADWNLNVKIPLHLESVTVDNGVVRTYTWDLLNSNIGGILDEATSFKVSTFIKSVRNVMEDISSEYGS